MVRLKVTTGLKKLFVFSCFNSYMVRLKVQMPTTSHTLAQFQFLHGTIKGFSIMKLQNPTDSFQFLHGTIKGELVYRLGLSHQGFNSYMVRLKEKKLPKGWVRKYMFQFLHGTIKGRKLKLSKSL